jgi:hypothetical protein
MKLKNTKFFYMISIIKLLIIPARNLIYITFFVE